MAIPNQTQHIATVRAMLARPPRQWTPYFAEDAVYRFSGGSEPEPRNDTVTSAFELSADEWRGSLPKDLVYTNPYGAELLFARIDAAPYAEFVKRTGHHACDTGLFFDTLSGREATVFADALIARVRAEWSLDGSRQSEFRLLEFNFNARGQVALLKEIEDDVQGRDWFAEYSAGTYAARVGEKTYTGAELDVFQSAYEDAEVLRQVNLATIAKWWTGVGHCRSWMRFPLVTDDATMGVSAYLMSSSALFVRGGVDQTELCCRSVYRRGTLAGNRVCVCRKEGWLDPVSDLNSRWGWVWDNRLFCCLSDPNLFISESKNGFGDYMHLQFTMRDGLIRDFTEICTWFRMLPGAPFRKEVKAVSPDYHV